MTAARRAVPRDLVAAALLVAGGGVTLFGTFAGSWGVVGGGAALAIAAGITGIGGWPRVLRPLLAGARWLSGAPRRLADKMVWWHQLAQLAALVAGAAALVRMGAGWWAVAVLVVTCTLVALSAGDEGQRVEQRRRDALLSVRRNG